MSAAVDLARVERLAEVPPAPPSSTLALQRARELLAPQLSERQAPAYPVHALGPLADACTAIAEHGQVQPAMVGQCLLGAASLLTQGLYNVATGGGTKPLTLYLLTLGDSGSGKSTAQGVALRPISEQQREHAGRHRAEMDDWRGKPRGKDKGEPPPPPAYRLCSDSTVEGLRRDLEGGSRVCSATRPHPSWLATAWPLRFARRPRPFSPSYGTPDI